MALQFESSKGLLVLFLLPDTRSKHKMYLSRQRDHCKANALARRGKWGKAMSILVHSRCARSLASRRFKSNVSKHNSYTIFTRAISTTQLEFNFNCFTDAPSLFLFRLHKGRRTSYGRRVQLSGSVVLYNSQQVQLWPTCREMHHTTLPEQSSQREFYRN